MATKKELLQELQDAGLPATSSMTKDELEEMRAQAAADGVFDGEQSEEEAVANEAAATSEAAEEDAE